MNCVSLIVKHVQRISNFNKLNLFIGGIILLIIIFTHFKYKSFEEKFHLSMTPDGLNVSNILYVNEETFGFGPGGNETGLIVYELSDKIAAEVERNGITYFANMPPNKGVDRDFRGQYSEWNRTPMLLDQSLKNSDQDKNSSSLHSTQKISNYLNQYGFSLEIDPLIEKQIDDTLSKSGSYFAYGRTGMLIVAPDIRRVFYAYAG